jgi:hypothetical protein
VIDPEEAQCCGMGGKGGGMVPEAGDGIRSFPVAVAPPPHAHAHPSRHAIQLCACAREAHLTQVGLNRPQRARRMFARPLAKHAAAAEHASATLDREAAAAAASARAAASAALEAVDAGAGTAFALEREIGKELRALRAAAARASERAGGWNTALDAADAALRGWGDSTSFLEATVAELARVEAALVRAAGQLPPAGGSGRQEDQAQAPPGPPGGGGGSRRRRAPVFLPGKPPAERGEDA